jgi:hypothetical protein
MAANHLSEMAYRVIEELSVRVGPRPAGSEAERQALNYVADELSHTGQDVRRMLVKGIPGPFPARGLRLVGGMFLVYSVHQLVDSPRAMLIFLVMFFVLPRLVSFARKRASAGSDRESENVIGFLPALGESRGNVLFCAHVDTAKASRLPGEVWPRMNRLLRRVLVPFVFIMSVAAALRWLDMRAAFAPPGVWQVVTAIGLAIAVLMLAFELFYAFISQGDTYSPGANDNASGVGLLLALSQHLRHTRLTHLDTYYAILTAEEVGLVGSERLARETELQKDRTYVINLDMVGAGRQLCYIRGAGLVPPRLTDQELNALLREAHPAIESHYLFVGNTDLTPFVAKGFRVASLCTKGDSKGEVVYHTERDTIDYIDVESLRLAADALGKAVALLDERTGQQLAATR